jgi:hypothetical protein
VRRFFEVSTAKAAIAVGAVALNPGFRVFPMEYFIAADGSIFRFWSKCKFLKSVKLLQIAQSTDKCRSFM